MKRNGKTPESIQDKHLHSLPDKTTNFAPTDIPKSSKQEQPPVQNEIQQKVKKLQNNLSPSLPVKNVMFWMWMIAGMIALGLNSVTRIHK